MGAPRTNACPLFKGPFQKEKDRLPTIIFQGQFVSFRGSIPRASHESLVILIPEVSVLPSAEELSEGLSHLSLKAQRCQSCVPRVDRMNKSYPFMKIYVNHHFVLVDFRSEFPFFFG